MSDLIDIFIIFSLNFLFFSWRYDNLHIQHSGEFYILSLPYHLSAIRPLTSIPEINSSAFAQSTETPAVTMYLTSISFLSVAKCTLLVILLLNAQSLGFLFLPHRRVYEPLYKNCQSRSIQGLCHPQAVPEAFPKFLCLFIGKISYKHFFHFPYFRGKSLHGTPVRKIPNIAFINFRLSSSTPSQEPFLQGSNGSNLLQNSSLMSCL